MDQLIIMHLHSSSYRQNLLAAVECHQCLHLLFVVMLALRMRMGRMVFVAIYDIFKKKNKIKNKTNLFPITLSLK